MKTKQLLSKEDFNKRVKLIKTGGDGKITASIYLDDNIVYQYTTNNPLSLIMRFYDEHFEKIDNAIAIKLGE
jgi:hypothetical protein